jgi:hypothetical protein
VVVSVTSSQPFAVYNYSALGTTITYGAASVLYTSQVTFTASVALAPTQGNTDFQATTFVALSLGQSVALNNSPDLTRTQNSVFWTNNAGASSSTGQGTTTSSDGQQSPAQALSQSVGTSVPATANQKTPLPVGPGGTIMVTAASSGAPGLTVSRFNANGSIDTTFGPGGVVSFPLAPTSGGSSGQQVQVGELVVTVDGNVVVLSIALEAPSGTPVGASPVPPPSLFQGGDGSGHLPWYQPLDFRPLLDYHPSPVLSPMVPLSIQPSAGALPVYLNTVRPPVGVGGAVPAPPGQDLGGATAVGPAAQPGPSTVVVAEPQTLSSRVEQPVSPAAPAASRRRRAATGLPTPATDLVVSLTVAEPGEGKVVRPAAALAELDDDAAGRFSGDLARSEDLAAADAFFAQGAFAVESQTEAAALLNAALAVPARPEGQQGQTGLRLASWWPWLIVLVVGSGGGVTWQGWGLVAGPAWGRRRGCASGLLNSSEPNETFPTALQDQP